MGNPFVHVELQTQDLGKARKFYQALFDSKLEDATKDYTLVEGRMEAEDPDASIDTSGIGPSFSCTTCQIVVYSILAFMMTDRSVWPVSMMTMQ